MPCQYGDEDLILWLTKGKRDGYLVDVGAADGFTNSNSDMLIDKYGWHALLIEPLPEYAEACRKWYANNKRVTVVESAVGNPTADGLITFYPSGQVSSTKKDWAERAAKYYGAVYGDPIKVKIDTITNILNAHNWPKQFDFLNIDAEGMDIEALQTIDLSTYRINMLSIESTPVAQTITNIMLSHGLKPVGVRGGNTWFGRE